jgi:K+-sensing histidine kinase KdpD
MVIEDSGVGIKKENLHKVFQDYSRLDEHQKMNAKGTGLGMSICKRIVD